MIKAIPIANLFLAVTVCYLKLVVSSFGNSLAQLFASKNEAILSIAEKSAIFENQISTAVIVLALISLIIAGVSLWKNICGHLLDIIFFIISLGTLFFSIVST
jgi:hypothetical protein